MPGQRRQPPTKRSCSSSGCAPGHHPPLCFRQKVRSGTALTPCRSECCDCSVISLCRMLGALVPAGGTGRGSARGGRRHWQLCSDHPRRPPHTRCRLARPVTAAGHAVRGAEQLRGTAQGHVPAAQAAARPGALSDMVGTAAEALQRGKSHLCRQPLDSHRCVPFVGGFWIAEACGLSRTLCCDETLLFSMCSRSRSHRRGLPRRRRLHWRSRRPHRRPSCCTCTPRRV